MTLNYKPLGPSIRAELLASSLAAVSPIAVMEDESGIRIAVLGDLSPETEAALQALIDAHDASKPAPVPPTRIEWGELIRALTPEEAAAFDAAVQAAEPRFRWLIQKTAYISTDDPDYQTLKAAFDDAFGLTRSDDLLPPSAG